MKVKFIRCDKLPETYVSGAIYFVANESAIYVAYSETEIIKYSGYKELENGQEVIEDLEEEIRTGTIIAESVPVVEISDIDNLFK